MSIRIIFSLIFAIYLMASPSLSAPSTPSTVDCDAELRNADRCLGSVIVVGTENIPLFATVQDMEQLYCDNLKPRLKCASGYKYCLKAFPKTIYSVIVNGLKKVGTICKKSEKKTEFINHFSCFVSMNSTELLTRIGNRVTLAMNHVLTVEPNSIIPNLCCAYHSVLKQVIETIDGACDDVSSGVSKNSGQFFIDIVGMAFNDPLELICGAYSTYQVCQEKIPKDMILIENATKWELTTEFVSTPMIPVLEIVQKLDEDLNV